MIHRLISIAIISLCANIAISAQNSSKKSTYEGYLFAYFEGSGELAKQEQIRFAVSADGINWKALNNNEPIISSADISQTGGVRDPHILRGEDGETFYMVATDMFTRKNGWDSNPGIVLLKSGICGLSAMAAISARFCCIPSSNAGR